MICAHVDLEYPIVKDADLRKIWALKDQVSMKISGSDLI